MRLTLTLLIGLSMLSSAAMSEQFYKWKDEKGVWHYSAKAPKDQPVDKLKVRAAGARDADDSEEEEEEDDKAMAKGESPESANCKAAKANLDILNSSAQVAKDMDGDGVAENLTLEQHAEEIATAERQKTAFCKPDKPAKEEEEGEAG